MPNSSLSETKLVAVSSASNLEKSHRELSVACALHTCMLVLAAHRSPALNDFTSSPVLDTSASDSWLAVSRQPP